MIDAIERAFRILELFSTEVPEWTTSHAARALELPKTTVWEHMQTLTALGYLRRADKSHYRLGWRAFHLGLRARMTSEIAAPALVEMAELSEQLQETLQLSSHYGEDIVFVEKVVPSTGVRTSVTGLGRSLPLEGSAEGRALLAARQEFPLPAPGYVEERSEVVEGMCTIAVPICNRYREPVWALSVAFLEYKYDDVAQRYGAILAAAGQRLSQKTLSAGPFDSSTPFG